MVLDDDGVGSRKEERHIRFKEPKHVVRRITSFFSSFQARLYGLVFLLHGLLCDSSVFCFFFCRGTFTDVHRGTLI